MNSPLRPLRPCAAVLLAIGLIAAACGAGDTLDDTSLGEDAAAAVAPALVPSFELAPGFEIEGRGRGIAIADLDGDGRLDLLSGTSDAIGPAASTLNLHLAQPDGSYLLATAEWGLQREEPTWGVIGLQEGRSGGTEFLLTSGAWDGVQPNHWLVPAAGGSTFRDAEAVGVCGEGATMGAALVDVDLDGDLDLVEANGSAHAYGGCTDVFLEDGGVRTASTEVGEGTHEGFGLVAADLTGDLYPELLIGVGAGTIIYRNLGEPPWFNLDDPEQQHFFRIRPEEADVEWTMASLSMLMLDYDQDGDLDAFTCTWESPQEDHPPYQSLLRNDGDFVFTEVGVETGVAEIMGCMGSGTGDLDLNGWPDLYLGTGGPNEGDDWVNALLMNTGGSFVDEAAAAGVEWRGRTHGIALVDMDQDGRMDLVANSGGAMPGQEEGLRVALHRGESYAGIVVNLEGPAGNPEAIGTRLKAVTDLNTHYAWRLRGEGFGVSSLTPSVVGLGQAETVVVEARFSDGRVARSAELSAPFEEITLRWADAD